MSYAQEEQAWSARSEAALHDGCVQVLEYRTPGEIARVYVNHDGAQVSYTLEEAMTLAASVRELVRTGQPVTVPKSGWRWPADYALQMAERIEQAVYEYAQTGQEQAA